MIVSFWINAFIPVNIPNLSTEVPEGDYAGKTMIPGPVPHISDCFLTDNRSFSDKTNASSRMHSACTIDTETLDFIPSHRCDSTHELDCEDGEVECTKSGDTTRMTWRVSQKAHPKLVLELRGASNNPCFTASPDIDYEGKLWFDADELSIFFSGKVDVFPAFEAYAQLDNGPIHRVFSIGPQRGATPWNLPGGATREVYGLVDLTPVRPAPKVTGPKDQLHPDLIAMLESLSSRLGREVMITQEGGKRTGPPSKSAHHSGIAADVAIVFIDEGGDRRFMRSAEVADELIAEGFRGVGEYWKDEDVQSVFAHGDLRGTPAAVDSGEYASGGEKEGPAVWSRVNGKYRKGRKSGRPGHLL